MTPLVAALRTPQALPSWTVAQWEMLVRQARNADLLSRLAVLLDDLGLLPQVPSAPRAHLVAAKIVFQAQEEAVHREVAQVRKALARTGAEVVLLKGAAYLVAGLPAARGRVFSDLDILVPRAALAEVEAALMLHGWATTHHDAYDQRYYRRWMHELPPMRHMTRQTVLDVHHAIVPPTARFKPDSAQLLRAARPVPGLPGLKILAPADMVLHSVAHLFLNEELSHGLRDLADLDNLLRHFSEAPGFWNGLRARAEELGLARLLFYGLRYSSRVMGTPVPVEMAVGKLPRWRRCLMDWLYSRAIQPDPPPPTDPLAPMARQILYLRAHWLRLPPRLLAYHLAMKAFRRSREEPATVRR